MAIGYKYCYRKILGFIATEGDRGNESVHNYLSCFPEMDYNVSVSPIFHPHNIGIYFNSCNTIYNHNRMQQTDLMLEKYLVTQNEYFRLETTVSLGMGITDGKLLFCHIFSEENKGKKIPTKEYKHRTVYDCFNNNFQYDFGSPDLNLPPIDIEDRPLQHNRARYTLNLLPATISVAYEKYIITLTTTFDSPHLLLLPSDDPKSAHAMNKYKPYCGRIKRGHCYRNHDEKRCYK